MSKEYMIDEICRIMHPHRPPGYSCDQSTCNLQKEMTKNQECRIVEKSKKQLEYVQSSITENIFLKACPGSGKTEVIGMKAAYEFQKWDKKNSGIAILTFTNNASDVIKERVLQFSGVKKGMYPHFVGTIDSWLHGYLAHPFGNVLTGYKGSSDDNSIRIVDEGINEGWINNYKLSTPYVNRGNRQIPLYANNIRQNIEDNAWDIKNPNSGEVILDSDYFEGNNFQAYRQDKGWLTLVKMREDFLEKKNKFFADGFATYSDMEWICYELLKEENFAERLAQRFELIIVDECQDLSPAQLKIFKLLKDKGSYIHFIGDLNQAIYEFKKVEPDKVKEFVETESFNSFPLSCSYRSCQPIVNTYCKIINESETIVGDFQASAEDACLCVEYDKEDMQKIVEIFKNQITERKIKLDSAVILARGWSTVNKLKGVVSIGNNSTINAAHAIYICKTEKKEALKKMGKVLSESYFKGPHKNEREFYCPVFVSSSIKWRIFVSKVLDEALKNEYMINDLSITWTNWTKNFREKFIGVIDSLNHLLDERMDVIEKQEEFRIRAPNSKGAESVVNSVGGGNRIETSIKTTTIHSVKGATFDAVMLVSSSDRRGKKGSHWEEWLDDSTSEYARFAYVASSRPRKLLVWAVPQGADFDKIQSLGFTKVNLNGDTDETIS